jgi:ribosomal protein S18 acetylase RimI-like enzyme
MPEIQIRPANAFDIAALLTLDHDSTTDYVWQMDVQQPDEGEIYVSFRRVRLPRSAQVAYPRSPLALQDDWQHRPALLVAALWPAAAPTANDAQQVVGYVSLERDPIAPVAWISDLVVNPYFRRRGIGSALILAAREWAIGQNLHRLSLALQPKNDPAISLAQKLAFSFCGYHERYFPTQEIALFFARSVG